MDRIQALLRSVDKGVDPKQVPVIDKGDTWFTRWDYERLLGNLQIVCPLDTFTATAMKLDAIPGLEGDDIWLVDLVFAEPQRNIKELVCLYVKPRYGVHVVKLIAWCADGKLSQTAPLARMAWESYERIRALVDRLCAGKEDEHDPASTHT